MKTDSNTINFDQQQYKSLKKANRVKDYSRLNQLLMVSAVFGLVALFLPWTQNVRATGYLTTLRPDHRPQNIQSPIPGRIEKWYVNEGDLVEKGDTILFISEVKNEYFDPDLVERTDNQLKSKAQAATSYQNKVEAVGQRINAMQNELYLKLEQAKNKLQQTRLKVVSDSIDLEAIQSNLKIAQNQFDRVQQLREEGLKSQIDLENKKMKLQEVLAKSISQENKFLATKNDLINASVEVSRIRAEYADKLAKAKSDLFTAESAQYDTEAQVTKLENARTNYLRRREMHYIKAPQRGYITKAVQGGIGETFKMGANLVGIMPANYEMAVETFVRPLDLPLIHLGANTRIQFDGWPAVVFSGWPNASYGTYGGKVVAIESNISKNGKYRILIAPDIEDQEWPAALRIGSGAKTIALLNDVPIWYEIWRQLNGFPQDYYQGELKNSENITATTKK